MPNKGGDAKMDNCQAQAPQNYMQQSRHDDGRMTREEAIARLKANREMFVFEETKQALDMAIEALQAESNNITESPNEAIKRQNDVIKKPRTVRYKLHKPIEYVSIEVDEEETVTYMAHYNEVVHCKDCKHLEVINTENTYAICYEHDIIFEPFEDSTKSNFCSWGERREE